MIAYLDSSVVLRIVFGEPGRLREFREVTYGFSSEILKVECLRTIDRMRIRIPLGDQEVARRTEAVFKVLNRTALIPLSSRILDRASLPLSTYLGTLDGIHLASALLWKESEGNDFTVLTHDRELGLAARSVGIQVLGC